jgi:hypothetical protein
LIRKIARLLKIKEMREQETLRLMQIKRRALVEAEAERAEAVRIRDEGERTYPDREQAVYDTVMGRVVEQDAVEDMKAALVRLAESRQELRDEVTRMDHVVARFRRELQDAREAHAAAVRAKEKYVFLYGHVRDIALAEAEAREESEIEELFSKPIRTPDGTAAHGG